MLAIKESVIVKNRRIVLELPEGFDDNDEVEVIVLSKKNIDETRWSYWGEEELAQIGKIGLCSQSLTEDDEDYSAW